MHAATWLLLCYSIPFFFLGYAASPSPTASAGVVLQPRGNGEKVLVAQKSFGFGDVVMAVPSDMCLLVRRDGSVVSGLKGQLDASLDDPCIGDLRHPVPVGAPPEVTWDVRLAFALLDATAGTSLAESGDFFDAYAWALQAPDALSLPLCMSPYMLTQLQNPAMEAAAIAQQRRLASVAGMYGDVHAHRVTLASWQRAQQAHPDDVHRLPPPLSPLQWAFALVRSRCFKAGADVFAFVPLIDMANHAVAHPAAQFEFSNGDGIINGFALRAARALTPGDEVTICYDGTHSNDRLMTQYGFTVDGNPNDDIALRCHLEGAVDDDMAKQACERLVAAADTLPKDGADAARVHVALRSLVPRIRALGTSVGEVGSLSPAAIVDALQAAVDEAAAGFPTTLADDRRILAALEELPPDTLYVPRDGRLENAVHLRACLRYRCGKKELLATAKRLLQASRST
jgi:hypothetical protein